MVIRLRQVSEARVANGAALGEASGGLPFSVMAKPSIAIREIALADIDASDVRYQYRLSDRIADLKSSLEREGQKEPIDVARGMPYRIIDGFRRVAALRQLGRTRVLAVTHDISDDEAHKLAFIKNVVRKNLSPLEKANAIRLAKARGHSGESIGKALGLSEKQVRRYERLLEFPEVVVRALEAGAITMAHAALLADDGVSDPARWLVAVDTDGLSAAQLRSRIRSASQVRGGRKNAYLRSSEDAIQGYKFSLTKDSPATERKRVLGLLEEAEQVLRRWGGARSR